MRIDKSLERLRKNLADRSELFRFARDVGHELPRKRLESLRELRTALAVLSPAEDDFAAGYLRAIADLLSAFEAETEQSSRMDITVIKARRWDRPLQLIAEGCALPSEIAVQLEMDQGAVTRLLASMRAAGLVEIYSVTGQDARTKPHALTPLGERVIRELRTLSPSVANAFDLSLIYFSLLRAHGRVHASAFQRLAPIRANEPSLADAAFRYLSDGAIKWCQVQPAAAQYLERSTASSLIPKVLGSKTTPAFIHEMARHAPPENVWLCVRSTQPAQWVQFFASDANPYKSAQTLDWADFEMGVDIPNDRPTAILFEDQGLLKIDSKDVRTRDVVTQMAHKFCLVPEGELILDSELGGVQALELAAA